MAYSSDQLTWGYLKFLAKEINILLLLETSTCLLYNQFLDDSSVKLGRDAADQTMQPGYGLAKMLTALHGPQVNRKSTVFYSHLGNYSTV